LKELKNPTFYLSIEHILYYCFFLQLKEDVNAPKFISFGIICKFFECPNVIIEMR